MNAIVVNGLGGDDTLDASGLFSKGATLNGGNGDDKLTGSGANLASVLQSYPSAAVSIGTSSSGVNLTSMGVVTVGSVNYSVWRMRNGTGSTLSGVSLTAFGSGPVFSGDLPAMTDTFFASPHGTSTHVLATSSGNITKAPGSQTFSFQTGAGDILNGNAGNDSITGGFGSDTINGGSGQDQIDGRSGDDLVLVREGEGESDTLSGGSGNDRVEILGNWARFSSFSALASSVESVDANGKEIRGTSGANLLDFGYLTSVIDSPLPGGGLLIKAGDGDDTVVGTIFGDDLNGGAGGDSLDGGAGDDALNGDSGNDSLLGKEGSDVLYGYSGVDSLDGGADNDVLQVYQGEAELGTLQGGSGTDVLEILGNWARFASFDAAASSLEVIDANGKDIHGNSNSNILDFSYVTMVIDSPVAGGGLRVKSGAGDDTVIGTNFGDELSGGAGGDLLRGGLGNDFLRGNSGNDTLEGQSGNDTLFGGAGVDNLDGGENDDILQAREGEAEFGTLQGGDGQDSLQVLGNWVRFSSFDAGASSIEVFDANGKEIHGNASGNLMNFSYLTTVMNSPVTGGGLLVKAGDGDDTVIGTKFADAVNAGADNDTVYGGGGDDLLNGESGDDTIYGDDPAINSSFNAINPGAVLVANVVGSGTTYTVENKIKLIGSAGLSFRNNGTVLFGQGGVSTAGFGVTGGNVGVASSRGIDGGESMTIEAADGSPITKARLTIGLNHGTQNGVAGSDGIVNYVIEVYDGSTLLNTITGSVSGAVNSLHDIPVDLGPGTVFTKLVLKNPAASGEPFALSKVSLDTVSALGGDDVITGGTGVDAIFAGIGNDTIQVRENDSENDTIQGGYGSDKVRVLGNWVRFSSFNAAASSIEVFDANGKAVRGTAGADTFDFSYLTGVLNSPLGVGMGLTITADQGDDTVIGTSFGDSISGGDGNDILRGLGGADVISGNDDDDVIEGGEGDDTLSGGKGSDKVSGGNGDDTIRLAGRESIGDSFDGGGGTDTLLNSANSPWVLGHFVTVDGSWTGGERNVSGIEVLDLNGQQIRGRSNGSGGDTDEDDDDLLDFSGVIINNLSPSGIDGRNGDDRIVGTSNADLIFGSGGNDLIYSGGGNDSLFGGAGIDYTFGDIGDDLISGGMQGDALEGGAGADTFWFKINEMSAPETYDLIVDFAQGVDKIRINFSAFGTLTPPVNPGTTWVRGQIIFDTVTEFDSGITIIRLPNNQNRMIKLLGTYTLTPADFDLY